ncbi:integral membrane protein [Fusarium mundagurra]|uniref:Integral membrane protein n=1 Tax=Fusarium mundagurra TaxID=1567541 RepID=A0A8H6DMN3_9HYPO|nr:integral membrane protein [Fusarium mundagurra]
MNLTPEEMAAKAGESRSGVVIGVSAFLMALSAVMVGLRLWCRRERQMLGLDDVTAVVALACILGCGSSIIAMTHYGLGRHVYTLSPQQISLYLRCFWVSILFYTYALSAIKLTFLIHYYRIMSVSNMRWLYLGALGFIILWGTYQGIGVFFFCTPFQSFWDSSVKGHCMLSQPTLWLISGIVHIVTDFAIIVMPLPIVWKLQLPLSQKIYLTGIFGLGTLTLAIAILRIQWLDPVADMTWWNVGAASWSMAEIVSGITCACLPTFKPLLVGIKNWLHRPNDGDSTICLQDQGIDGLTGSTLAAFEGHGGVGAGPKVPTSILMYGTQTSISAYQGGNKSKKKPIQTNAEIMTIHLIEASEEHLPAIARIATSAFHPNTDALSRRLFPPHLQPTGVPDGEAAYDWRFARKASSLASSESHVVVAIDDEKGQDDQVVGFSLWDAPPATGGDSGPSKEIQGTALDKEAYNEMKKTVNQDAVDTFGGQGIAGVWHLDYIGVSPGNQRRGIGKMLLQWGLDHAAAEGKDCYLVATEAGRPLYVAAGFKDVRVVSILGILHYSMILKADSS